MFHPPFQSNTFYFTHLLIAAGLCQYLDRVIFHNRGNQHSHSLARTDTQEQRGGAHAHAQYEIFIQRKYLLSMQSYAFLNSVLATLHSRTNKTNQ